MNILISVFSIHFFNTFTHIGMTLYQILTSFLLSITYSCRLQRYLVIASKKMTYIVDSKGIFFLFYFRLNIRSETGIKYIRGGKNEQNAVFLPPLLFETILLLVCWCFPLLPDLFRYSHHKHISDLFCDLSLVLQGSTATIIFLVIEHESFELP